ncbi:hypothetical protein [Staphylococcus gallinarum]|uniref:hypothetical protein n=1 Tax=Staphylococcus gallinarum TaxID=1293 RepID=UPI001E47E78C|nr:hypothetical protein [Staphylococcus gallinarum]MCD8845214.1 hypothetical protein [Staphylococcus gallinarum]
MCEEKMILFHIVGTFYEGEFGYELEDYKSRLLQDIKDDVISIVESEFGFITEFTTCTTYVPSERALYKDIFSFEYNKSFREKLYFKNNEEFAQYLWNEPFDGLLEPEIEEEVLVEIVKN